jgi:hypothetical protein
MVTTIITLFQPTIASRSVEGCTPQTSPANIDAAVWVESLDPACKSPLGDYHN